MNLGKENKGRRKPRIAFIGSGVGLPAEQGSGQGLPLITSLLERLAVNFDVVIYSLIRVKPGYVPNGITLRQISPLPISLYLKYILLLIHFGWDHVRIPFQVINAISAYPAGRIALALRRVFGRPVFLHLIGSEAVKIESIEYGDLIDPRLNKIVRKVCRNVDVLITLSDYQRVIVEENLGVRNNTFVLPRMPDLQRFGYRERTISSPVKFLHIASHQPVKDHATLFRAFAAIAKEVKCTLTVIGFEAEPVRQLVRDLEIEAVVKFLGIVPHASLGPYYHESHVLLHTSLYESLCGVALEAMASGLPVCATRVGLLADIGRQFAVTVPVGQPEVLAAETLRLIRNEDQYRDQQRTARKYIEAHDADWAAQRYKVLIESWLN